MADMIETMSSENLWPAPLAHHPVHASVHVPGSKSITNRAYILGALAQSPTTLYGALHSRDTALMAKALEAMGTKITTTGGVGAVVQIEPAHLRGGTIACGLAGTVMRFVPPLAALASGTVFFDGDPQARKRPMGAMLDALRSLGVEVTGDRLPFEIRGNGADSDLGGEVDIDASSSSQFVSGLLLSAARYSRGMTVRHIGASLPSMPHIEMTVDMLRQAGVQVDTSVPNQWTVAPGPIRGGTWRIEPDLSNATPFLAAAAVTGGTVTIPHWPVRTTQPGDVIRDILQRMGCTVELIAEGKDYNLQVTGPADGTLHGINIDMSDIGELTPTVAALAALASTPSELVGIAHLRGHETDRLAALSHEINNLGGNCEELDTGLRITPTRLHGGQWHSYADHRMATAGAIIGLKVPGVAVENIATTSKTLPGFDHMWESMLNG